MLVVLGTTKKNPNYDFFTLQIDFPEYIVLYELALCIWYHILDMLVILCTATFTGIFNFKEVNQRLILINLVN